MRKYTCSTRVTLAIEHSYFRVEELKSARGIFFCKQMKRMQFWVWEPHEIACDDWHLAEVIILA